MKTLLSFLSAAAFASGVVLMATLIVGAVSSPIGFGIAIPVFIVARAFRLAMGW
jgi:hypothetical protein